MQNTASSRTCTFFEGYACQFDEIYAIQNQKGPRGWLNRRLRASMVVRYEKTFLNLSPMKGHTVLDVGCGSGRYILQCLDLDAARVTGIDLSREMIGLTEKVLANARASSDAVELIVGDVIEYPFQDQYDYAIVMGVMDYVEEAEKCLAKLARIVKSKAVLSFPAWESIWTSQRRLRYMVRGCPLYFYSKSQLERLMRSSGFRALSIERINRDYFVVGQK